MVVGFTTTCAISAYHHWSFEFESRVLRGVLDTTLCDKVYQWLSAGRWFSLCTPVSSTNKTDCHNITELLLKRALNIISLTQQKIVHIDHRCDGGWGCWCGLVIVLIKKKYMYYMNWFYIITFHCLACTSMTYVVNTYYWSRFYV
jgi:hypothetical protein